MSPPVNDFIATEARFGARNYEPLGVVLSRGEGVWVWDTQGNRYLDCLSAYSAVNQGHCHPKILAAMVEQAGRLTLTSRAFRNDQLALFYEEIAALTGSHKVLPMNSGAEAVESAIKSVRKWGYEVKGVPDGQAEIIVCADNFHGRTLGIVGFCTDPAARDHFGPFAPGFKIIPFGDAEALEEAITPNTVAFLVEPIQGEAGVIIPPPGYFTGVRELCTAHDVMLILDEIQTGLGRTGKLLAEQHEGIEADVTLLGKALSGGFYPVSAVLSNNEVLGTLKPGQHGSTFGGNPLACAVARAALRVLVEEGMIENAAAQGARFLDGLSSIRSNTIREVRGRGLMLAVELHPEAGGARRYCEALQSPRHPRQGHPRAHHPHRPAACDHQRPGRLGAGADRRHFEAGFLVMAMLGNSCWSPRDVLDRIQRMNPGLGEKRVGIASPCQPRECREMQVHPGDQDTVGGDAIEHPFARSRGRGEIGIEGHAGFGKRGLHFRHVHRVAPDHQLILARCDEICGVARRMPEARHGGHAGEHFALLGIIACDSCRARPARGRPENTASCDRSSTFVIAPSSNQCASSFSCMTSSAFGNNSCPFDMSVSPAE